MSHYRPVRLVLYLALVMALVLPALLSACTPAAPQATVAPVEPTAAQPAATQPPATQPPPTSAPTQPPLRKVLRVIFTQEFDSLNPLYSSMWYSAITRQWFLNWPWEFDENNEAFPVLVTEIPTPQNGGISEDGTQITLKLRDDVRWSDGTPITGDDFIFTWQMAVDSKNTVASAYPYDNVESVTAPDERTVVITFGAPFAPWLATMWHGLLPAHILRPVYEAEGTLDNAEWNRAPTVGAGPYVFAEWESGGFARFVVNENYWGQRPRIDEIFVRFVPDDASQVAALKAGDAELGSYIAYSDIPTLQNANLEIVTVPNGFNEGLFFRLTEDEALGNPAIMDVAVRKAIAMSINREAVVKDLLLGLPKVPASYWDSLPFYNDPPLQNYPYDPEGAKKLLEDAGWVDQDGDGIREKDGRKLVFNYAAPTKEIRQDMQAVMQQDLLKVGIKVELLTFEADLYFSGYGDGGPVTTGQVDIMEWSDGPLFPDADIYYWLCSEIPSDDYPAGSNWFFFCNEELDTLIQQQASQVDPAERQKTISQINQIFYDKVYWLGLWQDPDVWAINPALGAPKLSGVTPFFDIVNWDITHAP